jgi:hypothetical protein
MGTVPIAGVTGWRDATRQEVGEAEREYSEGRAERCAVQAELVVGQIGRCEGVYKPDSLHVGISIKP